MMQFAMKPLLMKRRELAMEARNLRRRRGESGLNWEEQERLRAIECEMELRGMNRRRTEGRSA